MSATRGFRRFPVHETVWNKSSELTLGTERSEWEHSYAQRPCDSRIHSYAQRPCDSRIPLSDNICDQRHSACVVADWSTTCSYLCGISRVVERHLNIHYGMTRSMAVAPSIRFYRHNTKLAKQRTRCPHSFQAGNQLKKCALRLLSIVTASCWRCCLPTFLV